MKSLKLTLLALLVSVASVAAQEMTVSGSIIDASDNSPLPGATVQIKNRKVGTVADLDGKYSIRAEKGDKILVSFAGMKSSEVTVGNRAIVNIALEPQTLDEVVVVGYGSVKKRDLTGAVGSLKGTELMKGNPVSLSQGLQGKLAGVMVTQNDGAPGSGMTIQIRGINSFGSSSQPLYIVDGVPFDAASMPSSSANGGSDQTYNPLSMINPSDIESIEILKDASATAIYGSRGSNGVVIVTTKRGQSGKARVEFSANFGVSYLPNKVDVLDPVTYATYVNEGYMNGVNYNGNTFYGLPYPGKWGYKYDTQNNPIYDTGFYEPAPEDFAKPGWYTDQYGNKSWVQGSNWMDLITRTAFSQDYNLSVSGGTDKSHYLISGNYTDQEGVILGSDYTRYTLRSNLGTKVNHWLELGLNMTAARTKSNFAKTNASGDFSIMRSAMVFPTTYAPQTDADKIEDDALWLSANPYVYVTTAKDELTSFNAFNSAYAELTFTPWLKFRQNLGLNYSNNNRNTYYNRRTGEGQAPSVNGKGGQADNWYQSVISESILTFNKTFNKIHGVNAVFGYTYENANWGSKSMSATNFPNDLTGEFNMGSALLPDKLRSNRGESALQSILFRANYTLMDRYLFTASFRRDGSSKFAPGNKYANFFSGAFAWRASEESFIKNLNFFDDLKLRLSYGQTGNQAVGAYATMSLMGIANYPYAGSMTAGVGNGGWDAPANPDLKWETTSQFDAGIDVAVLNNRIGLTVDYYYKKTNDLLQSIKLPPSTGFVQMSTNFGWVENQGVEITGKFYPLVNTPVKWDMNVNLSFNRNKIGGLRGDQYANSLWSGADYCFLQRNGLPIGTIYGYVENGFYDNEAEVRADPRFANASAAVVKQMIGEIKYLNLDDDPAVTSGDRMVIGNTNPDCILGFTNNLTWKGFNLSIFFQGVFGNDIFNGNLREVSMSGIGNIPKFAYEGRWTPETAATATWPKANNSYTREKYYSNRYVENGSYLRLKNVTFGYEFKNPFKGVESIYLFANGTNLFTITDYSWFDPDVNSFGADASRRGVDINAYPSSRTFSFGVKCVF